MKVMEIAGEWAPEHIKPATRPDPEPAAGEIVVAIKAVSINPRDLVMSRRGYGRRSGTLPLIPLCDGAGEVVARGKRARRFEIGDKVCPAFSRTWLKGTIDARAFDGVHGGPLDGTMCEYMALPEHAAVRAPEHLSAAQSATLVCAGVTAWNAIAEQGRIMPGDRVLLQGTGAVSLFALQFAKLRGAEVIMTSSSDEKLERVRAMGADHVINYKAEPDWHKQALALSDGRGVDHIVDVGGADTLEKSTVAVRPSGSISVIGVLGGIAGEFNLGRVVTGNVRLQGVTVGSREMFENMSRAIEQHGIEPVLDDKRFAFEDLGPALLDLPKGDHFGKIVCEF
jgi:NADPH:quinone reductase-like Zn-dependent oxidoreductase